MRFYFYLNITKNEAFGSKPRFIEPEPNEDQMICCWFSPQINNKIHS